MSEKSRRALRGSARAVTGIVISGLAAAGAVALGAATPLPVIERTPISLTADTLQGAARSYVCAGSFTELGADPGRPSVALPVGIAQLTVAGEGFETLSLQPEQEGGTAPQVLRLEASTMLAAVQTQQLGTATLRGLTASSCAEPLNEQWLVGGASTLGVSTILTLGNPAEVPATVQLTVYDENGQVDSALTSGVLVPAGAQRTVSINGYAPARERLAVRVESTGAAVTAALGVSETRTITPFAVDAVTRQLEPNRTLVFPGIANLSEHRSGPGDAGELDPFPVVVRVLAPGGESGSATVRALLTDGSSEDLGVIEFADGAVAELPIQHWPEAANAVVVTADAALIGGVRGSADTGDEHDYAWFAPAPELAAGAEVHAAVAAGGELVLANPGEVDVEVQIAGGKSRTVPAGGAIAFAAAADTRLTASAPIFAGVRLASGGDIAGYPVLAEGERVGALTVYPR